MSFSRRVRSRIRVAPYRLVWTLLMTLRGEKSVKLISNTASVGAGAYHVDNRFINER